MKQFCCALSNIAKDKYIVKQNLRNTINQLTNGKKCNKMLGNYNHIKNINIYKFMSKEICLWLE